MPLKTRNEMNEDVIFIISMITIYRWQMNSIFLSHRLCKKCILEIQTKFLFIFQSIWCFDRVGFRSLSVFITRVIYCKSLLNWSILIETYFLSHFKSIKNIIILSELANGLVSSSKYTILLPLIIHIFSFSTL